MSDPVPTRRRILDAFAAEYGASGAADIEAVAVAAGVSRSTVYRHFADAAAMLDAAREEGLAAGARLIEQHLAPALRGDPGSDVLTGSARLVGAALRDGIPFAPLLRFDAGADAVISEHFKPLASEMIRRAQRQGVVDGKLDPASLFVATVSLCRGLIAEVYAGAIEPEQAATVAERYFESLRPR